MNEILQSYLTQFLDTVKAGTNFIVGELPKVAQEILAFNLQTDIFYICLMTILTAIFIIVSIISNSFFKKWKKEDRDRLFSDDNCFWWWIRGVAFVIAIIMLIITLVVIPCCLYDIIKINTAPRLYLIDFVKNFIKN